MHEGRNARVWVQIRVRNDLTKPKPASPPIVPASTRLLTRVDELPLVVRPGDLPPGLHAESFETMHPLDELYAAHNEMSFYTWSGTECCLPKGATRATLAGQFPRLKAGDVLIFKEIAGAETGEAVDADPRHAHAVRLTRAGVGTDPVADPDTKVHAPITEIGWSSDDALPFPLCVSAHFELGDRVISKAFGNIVLADHGQSIADHNDVQTWEALDPVPQPNPALATVSAARGCDDAVRTPAVPRYRPALQRAPLTRAAGVDLRASAAAAFRLGVREVAPVVELRDDTSRWLPVSDLLSSDALAREFVVESDDDETRLRFGDDRHGKQPDAGTTLRTFYRIGNGRQGNVGAEAIAHIVLAQPAGVALDITQTITAVLNPLPAEGGIDPEPIEDVRQKAPVAFRTNERAVTERDYEDVAQRHPEVQRAAATFRWTGSWHTVFLTVDRLGGRPIDAQFEDGIRILLDRYRVAGVDVEVDTPRFVPLELELTVCVKPDYFRADVERGVLAVLGTGGIFNPDLFTFGQAVYLSSIIAAVHSVAGVQSVEVRTLQRQGRPSAEAFDTGAVAIDRLEIARLDNDPNFPERGVVRLTMGGGR
jgi:hypothetical protein